MTFPLGPARTYTADLDLFQKLGLKPFVTESQDQFFVGEVKLDRGAYVKISVTCMPAQFWEFEIKSIDGNIFEMSTGSGRLMEYWGTVMQIANGRVCVNRKK